MKIGNTHTIGEIATFLGRELKGNPELIVTGINEIHRVEMGDLLFVDHPKYYEKAISSAASFIIIDKEVDFPENKAIIISPTPFEDYNCLTQKFRPFRPHKSMTGEECEIAETAHLSPNCFIGNEVIIGENVIIHPGAYIGDRTIIEDNVIIGPNAVIGHSAFYYKRKSTHYERMHTCGYVHIEKNVEVGASTCIDAGVSAITHIGSGTKIDNMVQIGHDTVIGKNCLFAAGVGIAGCVTIEDDVIMWGQVGCASGVTIGKGAIVLAQSGIGMDLEPGKKYFGSPCVEARDKMREMALVKQLPLLFEKLKDV